MAPVDALNDGTGNSVETEDLTPSTTTNEQQEPDKDYQKLYENQKIRAEKAEAALKAKADGTFDPELIRKEAEEAAKRTFDQQYIDSLGLPEDITKAIEKVAAVQGMSLKQASQDGYVQALIKEHERSERVKAATPSSGEGASVNYVFDPNNPPNVDVSTPEGAAAIEQWEKDLEKFHSQ